MILHITFVNIVVLNSKKKNLGFVTNESFRTLLKYLNFQILAGQEVLFKILLINHENIAKIKFTNF